jgi:hypothetical protein
MIGVLFTSLAVLGENDVQISSKSSQLQITKVIVRNSEDVNEFGYKADWFELKNVSEYSVSLTSGDWFITDKGSKKPSKFKLPELELAPGESVRIWCDGNNVIANEIHTNFKLSSRGEHIALFKVQDGKQPAEICSLNYPKVSKPNKGLVLQADGTYLKK